MVRSLLGLLFGVMMAGVMTNASSAAEMKTSATQKTKDVVVTLQSEFGHWTKGKNSFVLEIASAKDKQPVDAGKVTLSTSMTTSGMPPMIGGASLPPDRTPRRHLGTIEFPDSGTRQVTVAWDGPAGKGASGAGAWLSVGGPTASFFGMSLLDVAMSEAQPGLEVELTVDEVVARAIADNPDLRGARAETEAAVGRLRQAGLRPNPMLELGGQKALSPDNNVSAGVTLPLDLNGRKDGRVGVAERELEMKRAQVVDRERRLRADVRIKASEVLAARRNLEVAEELLTVNRDALHLVRERVGAGSTPSLEESLMLVEVNRLDASRQLVASRVEVTSLQLKALAGMSADAPLSLRGELRWLPPDADRAEGLRRALAQRPDLDVVRAEVARARAMIRKEEAEGRWDASVNVGYQRQDFGYDLRGLTARGGTRPIQDVFHYFGGGVSITLPVRNRNQGSIAAARAEADAADRRQEFLLLTVRQEVNSAFTQYDAARRSLEIFERGVRDVARRNLDVVRQTYELGRGSVLDVIAEQRRYIDIENGYTEALKQVYDASVDIERVIGTADR